MAELSALRRARSGKFRDRRQAGRVLADHLEHCAGREDVVVLALPRGGVPVALEVAVALGAPLDVFVVRKLGAPGQPELAMGAVAGGGALVVNRTVVRDHGVKMDAVRAQARRELARVERQERAYRDGRPPLDVRGRTALLVDDGLATGASARAAVSALRRRGAAHVVVATPVAPADACQTLEAAVDEVVCPLTPERFSAVGDWYEDFAQVGDQEARELLALASRLRAAAADRPGQA